MTLYCRISLNLNEKPLGSIKLFSQCLATQVSLLPPVASTLVLVVQDLSSHWFSIKM